MITFYLHWGNTRTLSNKNTAYFKDVCEGRSKKIKILCVYFAREHHEWEKLFQLDTSYFTLSNPEKNISFVVAKNNRQSFLAQIQSSDIIFIKWGNTQWLIDCFQDIPDLKKYLDGKIIAWSSAWALVFSKYFYENDKDTYLEWLSWFPVKMICHYDEKNIEALEILKNFKIKNMEIWKIPEQEYIIKKL